METTKIAVVTEAEFQQHDDNSDGLCLSCLEFTCGGVEPDATDYRCDCCGLYQVVGTAEALLMGRLDFKEG